MPLRNDSPENPRSRPEPDSTTAWEVFSGRGDPEQRYQLRRLCPCEHCEGKGKKPTLSVLGERSYITDERCPECRGEGRVLELVATAGTPEAVGVAIVQLGREGEWGDCPFGLLDTEGETGQKWLISPWEASARNATDAGRVLQRRRRLTK